MSNYPEHETIDGLKNIIKNVPQSAYVTETSTVGSATPLVLTVNSTLVQTITGSTAQTVNLAGFTGVMAGFASIINNQSSSNVTVKAADGTTIGLVGVGAIGIFRARIDGANNTAHWVGDIRAGGAVLTVFSASQFAITQSGTQTLYQLPSSGTPAASTLAIWDAQANLAANAFLKGTASTVTSAGTLTLTIASAQVQIFTGSTAGQIVKLPTTSVPAGYPQTIINQSSVPVTVQSSGANTIGAVQPNTQAVFVSQKATPTAAADWQATQPPTVFELFSTTSGIAVPPGADLIVECGIQGGNGGGSGRRGAAGSVRCGGGGGGSGAMMTPGFRIPNSQLSSTITVTMPAAGTGGAAVTADGTDGNPGTVSAALVITSGSNSWSTFAGAAAAGGTNALGTGGTAALGPVGGMAGGSASATGGTGGGGGAAFAGGTGAGGAGGGITNLDVASNGGTGGPQKFNYPSSAAAPGGSVGGATPGAGNAAQAGIGGLGAGGGAASITGAAQAGASATGYGGGGGGGGASLNGNNSGKGGDGGPPYFRGRWAYA